MLKTNYDKSADVLCLHLSDSPVVRDVSYGWNVSVGYTADGHPAEITILDASRLLAAGVEDDDRRIALTERESLWLLDRLEHPPRPTEHMLKAMARRRELLREYEPPIDNDEYAWMNRQLDILRTGRLDAAQVEALARHFEAHVQLQLDELCALLRRLLIDLRRLEADPHDQVVVEQLAEFRDRAANELSYSPSLRGAAESCLETVWQQARSSLKYHLSGHDQAELPEHCPCTLGEILGEAVPSAAGQGAGMPEDVAGDAASFISHVTPAGGNVFLDLGFPADEAERLKRESDRRIAQTEGRATQEPHERQTHEAGTDDDSGRVTDHRNVRELAMSPMERKLNYVVVQEEGVFVARCLDVEVASDGATEQEALAALQEALALYFEDPSKPPQGDL